MTQEDVIYRFRQRTMALAAELGNVRAACRVMGIHPSTYYRWRREMERYGIEMLRPRERRHPRMPNATPHLVERRVIAFSLAHPGAGPQRISDELRRPKWGGIELSPSGVYGVLRRNGLNTRAKRLSLIAGHAAVSEPEPRPQPPERHLDVDKPGELVQFDCFRIGKLAHTKGVVWQYTAIDVGSAYAWAEIHVTRHIRRVAIRVGWRAAWPGTSRSSGGRSRLPCPTTAVSSATSSSATPSRSSAQSSASSGAADPRRTAVSSAFRAPSSRSAGNLPSPATSSRATLA